MMRHQKKERCRRCFKLSDPMAFSLRVEDKDPASSIVSRMTIPTALTSRGRMRMIVRVVTSRDTRVLGVNLVGST
jgi:hypothetical protein